MFSLYLQRKPAGTFDDPGSFTRGDCIATSRRTNLLVETKVGLSSAATTVPLLGNNVFPARLIASMPFECAAACHDLAHYLGDGITLFGTASATLVAPPPGLQVGAVSYRLRSCARPTVEQRHFAPSRE